MTDILEQLRQQTHPAHLEVEALSGLMDDRLTLEGYGSVLLAFAGVYGPLEARLLTLPLPGALELPRRLKAGRLQADLEALGLERRHLNWPELDWLDADAALGALYVMEGATLGGQVISRRMAARFGLSAERGLAFFSSYGAQVGPMWKAFRVALLGHCAGQTGTGQTGTGQTGAESNGAGLEDPERAVALAAAIVSGANSTFGTFAAALRRAGAPGTVHPALVRR